MIASGVPCGASTPSGSTAADAADACSSCCSHLDVKSVPLPSFCGTLPRSILQQLEGHGHLQLAIWSNGKGAGVHSVPVTAARTNLPLNSGPGVVVQHQLLGLGLQGAAS
jgi:hypothetical protein